SGSEMIIDLSCASYISAGETEMNLLSSTLGDSVFPLFSADFVRGVMYQLLHGVAYLHNQGLAHNDLKLQNILLFANGELKISDLGSVLEEYNDQGTPMYISPEVCKYFYCAEDVEDEKIWLKLTHSRMTCGAVA
ncbi:protein kinase, partial [Trypanosoma cruzi]